MSDLPTLKPAIGFRSRSPFVQNRVHLFGDGHLDAVLAGEFYDGSRRFHSLREPGHVSDDFLDPMVEWTVISSCVFSCRRNMEMSAFSMLPGYRRGHGDSEHELRGAGSRERD